MSIGKLHHRVREQLDINSVIPSAPFLYSLETSENHKVFCCFQEVEEGCIEVPCEILGCLNFPALRLIYNYKSVCLTLNPSDLATMKYYLLCFFPHIIEIFRIIEKEKVPFTGLHKLQFFVHEISCTQNRFTCTSLHVGNRARKRADVHVTNNNMIRRQKLY